MSSNTTTIVHPTSVSKPFDEQDVHTFAYDYSYWSFAPRRDHVDDVDDEPSIDDQEVIFNDLGRTILSNAYRGYNCSLLAYGQTGAGKTFSMMGGKGEQRGLIPRICEEFFSERESESTTYKVEVSYLEIYSERIRDLLNPSTSRAATRRGSIAKGLRVREHPETGPYVEDLSRFAVNDYEELEGLMNIGNKERTVASTNMNATSSRSHAVFTIVFTQTRYDSVTNMSSDIVAKVQLVDLAGSERVDVSGVKGIHLKEAANINKSLTTLGRVIQALAKASESNAPRGGTLKRRKSRMRRRKTRNPDDVFIPFRDSVLTWLLKDSLGGNSKTIMIAAISPADVNYEETLSTLRYAARAKKIVNKAVVNEDPNAKIIRVLRKEIDDLRRQLESQSQSGGQDDPAVEELREQLAQSQKIIADINRSWEQKLQHSRDVQLQRIRELEQQGVAVSFNSDVPYLINLNEDPSMSESVLYHIQPGEVHVGRKKTDGSAPCIVLRGLKVQDHHAIFENHGNEVTVRPYDVRSMPAIYLNGELIITERQMYHGDRIIFGQNHVFRFCLPRSAGGARTPPMGGRRASGKEDQLTVGTPDRGRSRSISSVGDIAGELMRQGRRNTDAALDWEFATRERTITMGGVDSVMGAEDSTREKYRLLEEKLKIVEREKLQNATLLRQQQDEYRRLLQHFQVSAEGIDGYSDLDIEAMMAGGGLLKRSPSEEERFRAEEEARAALRDGLLHVIPLVEEGNAICEDLQRDVSFEIELITEDSANAPSFELDSEAGVVSHAVSPLQRLRLRKATHIFIKVRRGKGTRFSLWSEDEFVEKLVALRELHHLVNEYGEEEANSLPDPLAPSTLEIQRIGVAHIYLESLRYGVGVQQRSQILDRRGDFVGLLTVQIHCTEDGLEELEPVEAEFDEMEANLSIAAQRRQEQEHLRVRKEEQERGRSIQAGSPLFPRRSAVRSADSDESYLAGDGVDFNESEPPSVAASGRASPTESDVSAVTDGSLDRNDMFQTVERTAGRFRTLREVESQVPEVGKPLPITLRVSRVDRLPATGIRDVVVKYQFFKDRHAYQTKACQVTPHHTDGGSIESEQFGVEIRRRRFSSRISSPLHFNYVARHDQPAVTDELLRYFKTNAIAFEIWGRFDTTAVRTLGNHRQSIIGSLPLFLPITPQPTPPGTPERSRSPVADVRIIKPRRGSSDDTDGEPPQSGTLSLPRSPRGDPSGALTPRRAHGRHTSLGPAGAKSNLYFVAVDVEERDPQGRYNPCQVKASPGDDPANVFRVTAGSERPKRFVISCMQVDPHDFILESAATCEVVALTSELRARSAADVASAVDGLVSSVSSGDLADDASSHSSTAASPNIPINRKLPSVRERSDHFPINMDVWDQNYQIRNKMLTIYSEWPRELSEQMLLRRVTSPGERIVIDVSTSFYLSKMTDPVVISTRVAVKVYEPSTTVSTMRSFFRHVSPDRLFTIGNYFRLTRVKTKDVSLTILDMHKQQRAKLEHSMRIEQTQQHITLIKVLEAINSTKVKEAQLGFETSLERMRAMSALEAPELDADIQHEQRASSPVSGIRTIVTVDRIPSQDTVVKSGKLLKRGKFHTTWKRRWFVLRPPYLFYYKHASDRKHKGVVDLIGASISFGTKEQQERDPNSFEIHATTRVWYLRAPDNKSMQAWIEAILEFGD